MKKTLRPWDRFLGLLQLEKKDILQIFYYAIFSGLVALSLPLGIQAIINLIQGAQFSTSWLVLVVLISIGVIFSGVLNLMQLRIIENIQQRIFTRSSFELSNRFPKMITENLRNEYPPELANRFFDTLTIQKTLAKILIDGPASLLQVAFALILLSFYHPFFILFGIILITTLYFVFQYTARKGLQTSIEESKYKYKVAHWIQEIARTFISFKIAGKTNLNLDKNDLLVEKYLNAREKHFSIIKFQFLKMIGFKTIVTVGLLVIGGFLVLNQQINIGQFVAAEIIIISVISSVEKIILGLDALYDMLTSLEKLGLVVDRPLESNIDKDEPEFETDIDIQLDKVSYILPNGKKILEDVSLKIDTTSRILLQGESGSGKSSLLNIISGIIKPTSGNIYVNNLSIENITLDYYRNFLGFSMSGETPFEGTLRENLTFGNTSISDDEIYKVLRIMALSDFLKELPNGLNTIIYPEGKQLSYTITKKIILSRAILKKPKILILEDAIDRFNENEIKSIIDFICSHINPWGLIVVSNNSYWGNYCNDKYLVKNGKIENN